MKQNAKINKTMKDHKMKKTKTFNNNEKYEYGEDECD